MPRDSAEVGAAWGRLFGLAVHACKACHASKCNCDGRAAKPYIPKPETTGHAPDPTSELSELIVTPSQRCESMWTTNKGEVLVSYDQPGSHVFDYLQMFYLQAGETLSTNGKTGTPNPMNLPGPGKVEVTIDPLSERGLYVGHVHSATGAARPVLIYIDDVI